jgi:hypothetical protein
MDVSTLLGTTLFKGLKLIADFEKYLSNMAIPLVLWRDKVDVPSVCTIVKTIEWVGPAYGRRQ